MFTLLSADFDPICVPDTELAIPYIRPVNVSDVAVVATKHPRLFRIEGKPFRASPLRELPPQTVLVQIGHRYRMDFTCVVDGVHHLSACTDGRKGYGPACLPAAPAVGEGALQDALVTCPECLATRPEWVYARILGQFAVVPRKKPQRKPLVGDVYDMLTERPLDKPAVPPPPEEPDPHEPWAPRRRPRNNPRPRHTLPR